MTQKSSRGPNKAVALKYEGAEEAPSVLATGLGDLARRIVQIAEQHGVPVHQDLELVELLSHIPSGASIPPESFRLVAEIICFLYQTDTAWRENHKYLDKFFSE